MKNLSTHCTAAIKRPINLFYHCPMRAVLLTHEHIFEFLHPEPINPVIVGRQCRWRWSLPPCCTAAIFLHLAWQMYCRTVAAIRTEAHCCLSACANLEDEQGTQMNNQAELRGFGNKHNIDYWFKNIIACLSYDFVCLKVVLNCKCTLFYEPLLGMESVVILTRACMRVSGIWHWDEEAKLKKLTSRLKCVLWTIV